jgi:hypothetical protein
VATEFIKEGSTGDFNQGKYRGSKELFDLTKVKLQFQ